MPQHHGHRRSLNRATALAVATSLFALLPLFVVPALAITCPDNGNLTNADVSPGSGNTNTDFEFSVTYQDNAGETPQRVWARFANGGPDIVDMSGSGDLATGVVYRGTSELPAGDWDIRIRVRPDGTTSTCQLTVSVSVSAPPTPTPTPAPTPTPTPKPTPKPTAKPTAKATPKPAKATPKPTKKPAKVTPKPTKKPARVTPKPTKKPSRATPKPTATVTAVAEPTPTASPSDGAVAIIKPLPTRAPGPSRSPAPAVAAGTTDDGSGDASGGAAALRGLDVDLGSVTSPNPFLAWLIASAGGVLLFMALMRRSRARDEDLSGALMYAPYGVPLGDTPHIAGTVVAAAPIAAPPATKPSPTPAPVTSPPAETPKKAASSKKGEAKAVAAAAAAAATKAAQPAPAKATAKKTGKRPAKEPVDAAPAVVAAATVVLDDDAPLAAATTAAAMRAAATGAAAKSGMASAAAPRTFAKPPAKGVERFTMGYRRVRISDAADDVSSRELGRLDRGDEVELVGSFEGFLQIRTPDGTVGWIPRHTIVG